MTPPRHTLHDRLRGGLTRMQTGSIGERLVQLQLRRQRFNRKMSAPVDSLLCMSLRPVRRLGAALGAKRVRLQDHRQPVPRWLRWTLPRVRRLQRRLERVAHDRIFR